MDRLDRMSLFVRIVERGSFSDAAADLGMARSTATEAIKVLEHSLGVRLLERTTRHVTPTLDGQEYYQRCLSILGDIEDAEGLFRNSSPAGLLRIEAHGYLTRTFILPRLPEFLERYPELNIHFGQTDRFVDLVREGVDCVIRAGELNDSSMIARHLGDIDEVTIASADYIRKFGLPATPDDLGGHQMVGFVSSRTGETMPLEFQIEGKVKYVDLPSRVTANNSNTVAELARLGFGIMQAPRYHFAEELARGTLIELLADYPPVPIPLAAVYPQNRQITRRLRVFLDWVSEIFASADLQGR